jgi:peptidoglycan/xylan/chitin deacetylase (PgdA/CDA1 family)
LTFDDGFKDVFTTAAPMLGRYGYSATVFLPTHYIDGPGEVLTKGKQHLVWEEVRELTSQGIEFGSHTINHPMLRYCARTVIARELTDSKKIIEDKTGVPVVSFSNPYRLPFDDKQTLDFITDCLRRAGYAYAVSTVIGIVQGLGKQFFLDRLPINDDDDERLFIAKLEGAYNWVNVPQHFFRTVKNILGMKLKGKRF